MNQAHPHYRRHRHAVWAVRFALAGAVCIAVALYKWPAIGAMIVLGLGYLCLWLARRELRAERDERGEP
jgi:hypothetical protein